jgi:ubiquinone/menaquinone biosynthesis C-methylase UbiE
MIPKPKAAVDLASGVTPPLLRPSGKRLGDRIWPPAAGYDRVAATYDSWYWQEFWRANELPLLLSEMRSPWSDALALDVGTGTGLCYDALRDQRFRAVGLDVSRAMLQRARENLGPTALLVRGVIECCPFSSQSFELVVACRILSHVATLDAAFAELGRITRPGGRLLFSDVSSRHNYSETLIPVPNGDVHIQTFKHSIEQIVAASQHTGLWTVELVREVSYRDLVAPPDPSEFPSIDTFSDVPIFAYGVFSKSA